MSEIEIRKLRKEYGTTVASDSVDAVFESGSVTCLLGPSGCGKTTLLRMIAGLETPDSGQILLGGQDVTALPTQKRDLGMVFQYPVVYRGMTVSQNLELPLAQINSRQRLSPDDRHRRVREMLAILDLIDVADSPIEGIPNGIKQKVAVARAMIRRPAVVLFDEPVTNVDITSKLEIQRDIKRLVRELGQTVLYVTHDQTEAMTLADRIVLLQDGRIIDSGPPRDVFHHPRSRFAGHFLGSPGMNFLPADVRDATGSSVVLTSAALGAPTAFDVSEPPREGSVIGVRAERIRVSAEPGQDSVQATVLARTLGVGGRWMLTCSVGDIRVRVKSLRSNPAILLDEVWLTVPPDAVNLFSASGERIGVATAALANRTDAGR